MSIFLFNKNCGKNKFIYSFLHENKNRESKSNTRHGLPTKSGWQEG